MTDPLRALEALRGATTAFAEAELAPEEILRSALEHLIRVTGADAGAIAVPSEESDQPELIAERRMGGVDPVSLTVLAAALADPEGRTTIREPPDSSSVFQASITSILCTPVRRRGRTLAAFYLDRRGMNPPFDEVAWSLATSFAATLGLALDLTERLARTESLREEAEQRAEEARALTTHLHGFRRFGEVITRSERFARSLATAEQVARYQVDVLIQGETGTGKEHLARCIHEASGRSGRFVVVDCTTLPESIAENELFGHEPGAYTGAQRQYRGYVEQAAGGTLFLDEIGDLPLAIQPKLLRVLEDKRVRRVGGEHEIAVDVRIIAATHKQLEKEVVQGRFREDLFYRLKVMTLQVPPLRDRLEDLPAMAQSLLELACREVGRAGLREWEPEALALLAQHRWAGNVRELKNAIKQLCVLCQGPRITRAEVQEHLSERFQEPGASGPGPLKPVLLTAGKSLRERVVDAEIDLIRSAIRQEGSVAAAARLFGIRRQALHQRCKHLGLEEESAPGEGDES